MTFLEPSPAVQRGRRLSWWADLALPLCVAATLLIHGYHPLAEDGGLYVAGIKWLLRPSLFPHDTAFVTEHLRFSLFAPMIAGVVRGTRLPLLWVLLLFYVASIATTLWAGRMLLRVCGFSIPAQVNGMALLAAWWTIPVAGTSLMLMDPYLTARSFSTPLTLLALGFAMKDSRGRSIVFCVLALLGAAAFHPLMAVYGAAFVVAVRMRPGVRLWAGLLSAALVAGVALQLAAPPESAAYRVAVHSRYYWFLAHWQWFEVMGLIGPLAVLTALSAWMRRRGGGGARLAQGAIGVCVLALVGALLFAHESYATHAVARLQPLRCFLEAYAVMALLVGAWLVEVLPRRVRVWGAVALVATSAVAFCFVARATFPQSPQVEWPWREASNPNPWVQAFLWARANTPADALFAMDAKYVNTEGEDAQTFRAIAERSAIPDFSKDGGEAAITPALAAAWLAAANAQAGLSQLPDAERDAKLRPFAVDWVVLHADALTAHPCPYRNAVVKVCRL